MLLISFSVNAARADELSPEMLRFFESEVRPLLAEHCWSCHGAEQAKGGLRLDSHADLLHGGESGPAVEPGNLDQSLLIGAVRYESYEMPPAGQLDPKAIAVFERWVELGAPWPEESVQRPARDPATKISDEDRKWWAFQPLNETPVPAVDSSQWSKSAIDAFLYSAMQAKGLRPAERADRRTLIRRVYFDMLGLPPAVKEVEQFVADTDARAYERMVDRVLEDRRYGERWAQHWLDLTRYADSDGYRADFYRPDAWRYRDYVIRAFNDDKPYDQFVREQLAGDELYPDSVEAKLATGYLRNWIYEYNLRDARGQWDTILSDITDNAGDVFLGMGMQCAKCHDHKFDPILQRDYYRLRAFFEPILPVTEPAATADEVAVYEAAMKTWEATTAELRTQIDAIEGPHRKVLSEAAITRFPPDIEAMLRKSPADRAPAEHQLAELAYRQVFYEWESLEKRIKGDERERLDALRAELAKFDHLKPAPLPQAMVATDVGPTAPPTTIPGHSTEVIEPGFLTILDPTPAEIPNVEGESTTGRRAALANWLTRPDNPLSTRVIVNRVWQYHFGRGLAPNASDFGRLAGEPMHPELLDWLTIQFVNHGWSLKYLHRMILNSAVYQQATAHTESSAFTVIDPDNEYYWRADTRRLDAEQIRDAVLAISGELDDTLGGEGFSGDKPRRSIYRRIMRNSRDPFLDVFDLPLFFTSESSRNTTTTPLQSLMLINSGKMLGHARKLSARILAPDGDREASIQRLWKIAFGRSATEDEVQSACQYLDRAAELAHLENESQRESIDVTLGGPLVASTGTALDLAPGRDKSAPQVALEQSWPDGDFTIEASFQLRSIFESGAVRTLAAQHDAKGVGWAFGVTGKGSRRKPKTLVIQLWGTKRDGTLGEAALFSGVDIELDRPYYAAVSVRLARTGQGTATFYLRDLTKPDGQMSLITVPHDITSVSSDAKLVIGGRGNDAASLFDGLIDDVRITSGVPAADQLLVFQSEVAASSGRFAADGPDQVTVPENETQNALGFWRFAAGAQWRVDHSGHGRDLLSPGQTMGLPNPEQTAWVDLCHAILNSNEFLYVD